ncbi:SDR family NAD(P)-dependent oxidoreductase [Secundilactobacillus folii]|uniref:SDR family NAD(P)-dependent oxidoreductase n=1 Tax=Secundilactobacillus folii TaxID=2678357 RepID=A0A7X2XY85_9LACO|nr:SDR family NAD(P)-dependent oxidoreductase [Secundilactobacillus folii]MTV82536.1 SDR family NAD(P)-dependent oxidoreductase [Secundilactobacillus folii]
MKRVLITGANKGIGFALAQAIGLAGVKVLLGVRSEERGAQAAQKLRAAGVKAVDVVRIDLNQPATIEQAVTTVKAQYTDLDVLINNAGISGRDVANNQLTVADLRATLQVNFLGVYQLTMGLLRLLSVNHGQVVNITIPTDPNPLWNPLAYKSSKAALNVFTDSLALDMKQQKQPVTVYGIHPGPTTTDLNDNAHYPGFHTPAKVASKILPILAKGKRNHGKFIEIYHQISAGPFSGLIAKVMHN